jgi:hypothetical protein
LSPAVLVCRKLIEVKLTMHPCDFLERACGIERGLMLDVVEHMTILAFRVM